MGWTIFLPSLYFMDGVCGTALHWAGMGMGIDSMAERKMKTKEISSSLRIARDGRERDGDGDGYGMNTVTVRELNIE